MREASSYKVNNCGYLVTLRWVDEQDHIACTFIVVLSRLISLTIDFIAYDVKIMGSKN